MSDFQQVSRCRIFTSRLSDFYISVAGFLQLGCRIIFLQVGCRIFSKSNVGCLQLECRIFSSRMSDFEQLGCRVFYDFVIGFSATRLAPASVLLRLQIDNYGTFNSQFCFKDCVSFHFIGIFKPFILLV